MGNFIVSARKYRPNRFDNAVGQQHIAGTLKNALKTGKLAHAFLFCGPRGVGKTTFARVLAKTINCENISPDYEACDECNSCVSFKKGISMNVYELDAASNNSVDDIRTLVDQARYPPQSGKYKVYIIDEAHMLSQSAFNAFLKTLEEPPSYAIYILATTEKQKIIPTILSRCQIFDFNRIKVEDISRHLEWVAKEESIHYERSAIHVIAQKADGSLRDALSLFDRISSFSLGNITYQSTIDNLNILDYDYFLRMTWALLGENMSQALLIFDEILDKGFDGGHFIVGLCSHFRDLLVCKDSDTLKLLDVGEDLKQRYLEQSQQADNAFLLSALSIGSQAELNYKGSKNQRLQIELMLMKICHIKAAFLLKSSSGVDELEKKKKQKTEAAPSSEVIKTEPSVAAEEPAVDVKKKEERQPDITTSGSGSSAFGIPSLKNVGKHSLSNEEAPVSSSEISQRAAMNEPFTEEDIKIYWKAYAEQIYAQNKMSLYSLFTSSQIQLLPDSIIHVLVENKLQVSLLEEEKFNALTFLRKKLKNDLIDVMIVENKEPSSEKRLYTSTEKFTFLAQKNPLLLELKNRLDLDLEF